MYIYKLVKHPGCNSSWPYTRINIWHLIKEEYLVHIKHQKCLFTALNEIIRCQFVLLPLSVYVSFVSHATARTLISLLYVKERTGLYFNSHTSLIYPLTGCGSLLLKSFSLAIHSMIKFHDLRHLKGIFNQSYLLFKCTVFLNGMQ